MHNICSVHIYIADSLAQVNNYVATFEAIPNAGLITLAMNPYGIIDVNGMPLTTGAGSISLRMVVLP